MIGLRRNILVSLYVLCYNLFDKSAVGDCMRRNGFTLLEVTISIVLTLTVLSAAYALLLSAYRIHAQFVAKKELIENAPLLQSVLIREFERSSEVLEILDVDGTVHHAFGAEPINVRSLHLLRARNSVYQERNALQSQYIDQVLNLRPDRRRSVWICRNRNPHRLLQVRPQIQDGSYEVGVFLDQLWISRIEETLFQLELVYRYYETDIEYRTQILATIQK